MAKLTAEMKDFLTSGKDPVTVFVGTVNKDGIPNISAKGSFIHVIDDETLATKASNSRVPVKSWRQGFCWKKPGTRIRSQRQSPR